MKTIGKWLCLILALFIMVSSGCARRKAVDHYNKGVELAQGKQYSEAMTEFLEAIRLRSNFPEARNSLGYVLSQMRRYEDALQQFQMAAEDPKYKQRALAYLNVGTIYSNIQKYKEAENALKQSLEVEPSAQAHYTMAQVLSAQGKSLAALNALEQALKQEPERVYAMENDPLFESLRDNKRFEEYRTKYRK